MVIIKQLFTHTQTVTSEFIDHNNHMPVSYTHL
ncbi:thioesterase, partial [Staphylococcus aureus]|nr:thioesterase [Staphylococcus aureus]